MNRWNEHTALRYEEYESALNHLKHVSERGLFSTFHGISNDKDSELEELKRLREIHAVPNMVDFDEEMENVVPDADGGNEHSGRNLLDYNIFDEQRYYGVLKDAMMSATEVKKNKNQFEIPKGSWTKNVQHTKPYYKHAMVIDAGSGGSRIHVYEYEPHLVKIMDIGSGHPIHINEPNTYSRWTERLKPDLSSLARFAGMDSTENKTDVIYDNLAFSVRDDDAYRFQDFPTVSNLDEAVQAYMEPLMSFAKYVLRSKESSFYQFPIYLKATGGMRAINKKRRLEIMHAIRRYLADPELNPFMYRPEFVRTISGEEEAAFSWTSINFLLGNLIDESSGTGTVLNPTKTYGALDLGGASTQISFFERDNDIMSNLFKLQIGGEKHWNIYAHSFLWSGIHLAHERLGAALINKASDEERKSGIYNPCIPGNWSYSFSTHIHLDSSGTEMWVNKTDSDYDGSDTLISTIFQNPNKGGDFAACSNVAKTLLNLQNNNWCKFENDNQCSWAGVYQPPLPITNRRRFGEFYAFSNFYHVFKFLGVHSGKRPHISIGDIKKGGEKICNMTLHELSVYNSNLKSPQDEYTEYCFRTAFVYRLLHDGYGFKDTDIIRTAKIVKGQKVGWPLGVALYEINSLSWSFVNDRRLGQARKRDHVALFYVVAFTSFILLFICKILKESHESRRRTAGYEKVQPVNEAAHVHDA